MTIIPPLAKDFDLNFVMLNVMFCFRLKTAVTVAVAAAVGSVVGCVPHNSPDRFLLFTSPQRL